MAKKTDEEWALIEWQEAINVAKFRLARLTEQGLDVELMTRASDEYHRYFNAYEKDAIPPNDLVCLHIVDPKRKLNAMKAKGIDTDLFAEAVAEYVRFSEGVESEFNLTQIFEIVVISRY